MKKVNLLSKDEMKNVMGGVISLEVWLQMCYEGKFGGNPITGENERKDMIQEELCIAMMTEL